MENKTSRYFKYALGEIILVVIGILIALQINTWNEERKSRLSEKEILKRLAIEFEGAKFELEGDSNARREILLIADYLTSIHLEPEESFLSDSLPNALKQLMRARFYTQSHPTLNDLQSSGRLDLLSSNRLKQNLVDYLQAKDRLSGFEENERDYAKDLMSPFLYENLDLSKVYQSDKIHLKDESKKFEELLQLPKMGSLLNQRRAVTEEALTYSFTLEEIINDILEELGELKALKK